MLFQRHLNEGNFQKCMAVSGRSEEHYPLVVDIKSVLILLKIRSHLYAIALEIHRMRELLPGSDSHSKHFFLVFFFMNLLIYSLFIYISLHLMN